MKRLFILSTVLILVFSMPQISKASPLVFSIEKEVKLGQPVEVATFDAVKYKQIRITVKCDNSESLNSITTSGGTQNDKTLLYTADFRLSYTQLVDTPPEKISIYIKGEGKFRLYVWASQ